MQQILFCVGCVDFSWSSVPVYLFKFSEFVLSNASFKLVDDFFSLCVFSQVRSSQVVDEFFNATVVLDKSCGVQLDPVKFQCCFVLFMFL